MGTIQEILSANIKRLRKARGWTQNDLAVHAGISFRGLQSIEVGDRNPRQETLAAIAGALGVSGAQLFEDPKRGQSAEMQTPSEMTKDLTAELNRIKSEFSKIKIDERMSDEVEKLRSELRQARQKIATLDRIHALYGENFIDALLKAGPTVIRALKGLLEVLPTQTSLIRRRNVDQKRNPEADTAPRSRDPVARKKAVHEK